MEGNQMSVKEVETVINELVRGFNANDVKGVASLLSENLEVFDHVPYRFDNKKQFVDFLTAAMAAFKDVQFGFRQLSCRLINEGAAVANAYDSFMGATNDGKAQTLYGRTTLVLAKEAGQGRL
jgi:ketosteroid isomerase-like protein